MPLNNLITFRRGTSNEWSTSNPILNSGEPGWDVTNNLFKVGDGTTPWNDLRPINESFNKQTFNIESVQSELLINNGYIVGSVDLYYNGVKLIDGLDYIATNGSTVVLATPAIPGSVIEIINILPSLSFKNFVQSENIHPFLFSGM